MRSCSDAASIVYTKRQHVIHPCPRKQRVMIRRVSLLLGVFLPSLSMPANALAADPAQIQQAVERGVVHLKQLQAGNGSWPRGEYVGATAGATALAGLALLECDVPA